MEPSSLQWMSCQGCLGPAPSTQKIVSRYYFSQCCTKLPSTPVSTETLKPQTLTSGTHQESSLHPVLKKGCLLCSDNMSTLDPPSSHVVRV